MTGRGDALSARRARGPSLVVCALSLLLLAAAPHGLAPSRAAVSHAKGLVDTPGAARLAPPAFGPEGFRLAGHQGIRGMTVGPIENAYHPNVGYGSTAFGRTLDECRAMGATWVALTPFGRVHDLSGRGVDPTFERPHAENVEDVKRAVRMAHARGLKVMIVPHLWVESGEWRAKIAPESDAAFETWAASYERFVVGWARVAESTGAELFSAGVELRFWVTTPRAPRFVDVIRAIRRVYHGLVTYSANWDDADDTVIWGEVDLLGINAFYPLAERDGAPLPELREGGVRVAARLRLLADAWRKPVLLTEVGYTTRPNPAVRPWEWPDEMKDVVVDELAQAEAYHALLAPLLDEPAFAGFFVWRVYSDPDDVSQEAEWGFSPRGKLAELVVRDAFAATWMGDAVRRRGFPIAAEVPGIYP
jgi:hypothetical protein